LGLFLDGFSACFSRQPQREGATQYIDGLFNDSERKSMQAMHGRLGDPRDNQALQHFITHSPWQAARVWTQLRAVVPLRAGILALDDTGVPKQGTQSPGVQRQYCGALGKVGNCQVAVSSALIADLSRSWRCRDRSDDLPPIPAASTRTAEVLATSHKEPRDQERLWPA
jgi:SRSO17 transposase